jgi:hypothetical protein
MTRILFLFTWLRGPRFASRFALFYVLAMLFVFYCLVGGMMSYVPAAPAHAIQSPYPDAEAKSDSPEHSGSDAQENDQRSSNAPQRPRA